MNKNKDSKRNSFRMPKRLKFLLFTLAPLIIVAFVALVPIATLKTGSCTGGRTMRLGLFFDGRTQFEQAKLEHEESERKREEFLRNNPGIAMGCSIGPVYKLYLF